MPQIQLECFGSAVVFLSEPVRWHCLP